MGAELTHHLGYERHAIEGRDSGNNRNGHEPEKIQGDFGTVEIDVPRDRTTPRPTGANLSVADFPVSIAPAL